MTYWFYYSLELLLLLAGLVAWLSLGITLGKMLGISASAISKIVFSSLVLANLGKIARVAGIMGLGILMGIPVGRAIEAHQRDSNIKERHGVIVMSKESPRVYYFIDQKAGRQYKAVFCEDHDFEVGERFDSIKYLNTGPCWSLKDKNSSYFYSKGGPNEGWYPNANANAYARSNSVSDPQARPTAWNFPLAFLDGR